MASQEPIPKMMKAIQVVEFHKPYELNTVPVPSDLGPHDLLVKVAVASHCHTDSMVVAGILSGPLPQTASHEGSGTVVAVGSSVAAEGPQGFRPGDRVMCGLPLHPCGKCDDCLRPDAAVGGQRQYCAHVDGHVGIQVDGCFAEYVRVDARSTTRLPDQVSLLSAAPLACAGRTIWRAVQEAGLERGQWIALVGSGGGLGHLGIRFAKQAMGLNVIGIDVRDGGLELSRRAGSDIVVDARKGHAAVVAEVQAATGGRGADSTLVLSDAMDSAALACAVTKVHGTVVQIAQPDQVTIPFREFIFRDIRIKGSMLASAEESRAMVEAVAKYNIPVETNPFDGLESIEKLLDLVRGGKIQGKAVIVVDQQQIDAEKKLGAGN